MNSVTDLKERLRDSKCVSVLTGAGVSAESGVPTFRGGGDSLVWKGMPFEKVSSAEMVAKDLDLLWEWFDYRRDSLKSCVPNSAHYALSKIESKIVNFTLITQNIDGLHQRAGTKAVYDIHGNINRMRCIGCEELFDLAFDAIPHSPTMCEKCGQKLRPDVVLFGEALPNGVFEIGSEAAERSEIFFVIGTTALVYPAAMLPEIARQNGSLLVEINPEETALTPVCDISIRSKAGAILPEIADF